MKVQILKEGGKLPEKKHISDAGFDLFTPEDFRLPPKSQLRVKLGIAIEIFSNSVALVQGRSGLANKGITTIGNVIDSGYRGEISAIMVNMTQEAINFKKGDRIAQLVILQLGDNQEVFKVKELNSSDRDERGFGSTGV
jgi:dUTP pyrophosphatase